MFIAHLDPRFFYTAITIPFVFVWMFLCIYSPRTRREQLEVGAAFMFVGVLFDNLFYFVDYWHPGSVFSIQLGSALIYPESLVYGGAFAGIVAVLYQALAGLDLEKKGSSGKWYRASLCTGLFFFVSLILWHTGMNSVYATSAGAAAVVLACAIVRRDLLAPALWSGVMASGMMFVFYELVFAVVGNGAALFSAPIWLLNGSALDYKIIGVPITELVWGFCAGASIGIFYKYIRNGSFVVRPDGQS